MKQQWFIISAIAIIINCFMVVQAQTLTIDPALTAATISSSALENSSYATIKSKQTSIEALQTSTVAFTNAINNIQSKLYNGLQYVSSTVHNAYQIYD